MWAPLESGRGSNANVPSAALVAVYIAIAADFAASPSSVRIARAISAHLLAEVEGGTAKATEE
ncbi:MAG: hypothetical protein ACI89X_002976 [Planctomycetota bacterium]|jgi:hypothetical protein